MAKKSVASNFDFFKTIKTGDAIADSETGREISEWVDTGSYTLNAVLSGDMTKGFPGNRVCMLSGENSTGKSLVAAYSFCRPLVEKGYFIYYIDTENSVTDDTLISFGLPEGSFKIIQQDIIEELKGTFDKILTQLEEAKGRKIKNENKCAFVIDSQGMLDTEKSRKDIQTGNHVADFTAQKELKRLYKSILIRLSRLDIPMLITNHVYANIGGYGDTTKIAGGSGGLYASTVILHLRKKQYKEGTIRKGTVLVAKVVKSRFTRDGIEGNIYLNFEKGLNKWYGLHIFAEEAGLLEKWSASKFDKKGVVGPEKAGNFNWYVIKDPNKDPKDWIVCKEYDLHKESTIGTIFEPINDWVKKVYPLLKPVNFTSGDENEEALEIDEDNLEDAETAEDRARKYSGETGAILG